MGHGASQVVHDDADRNLLCPGAQEVSAMHADIIVVENVDLDVDRFPGSS